MSLLSINSSVLSQWESLQRSDARDAATFYFSEILPQVIAHQKCKAVPLPGCDFLVSLMGFSPETTVIAATILRPTRLLVVASENARWHLELCQSFLDRHHLLRAESFSSKMIDPLDHDRLFSTLTNELSSASGCRLTDLTGGKKIMSAVAGHAAWSIGLPVCYLESRSYNERTRRPEPGSEELYILQPPALNRV